MVFPAIPIAVPAAAVIVASAVGIRKSINAEQAFFSMNWMDTSDADDDEACVLLGEEAMEDGKQWFVCKEPAGEGMDCESVAGFGNPGGLAQHDNAQYLCKTAKV